MLFLGEVEVGLLRGLPGWVCRGGGLGRSVPVGGALLFCKGKDKTSTPDPRQDGNSLVLGRLTFSVR